MLRIFLSIFLSDAALAFLSLNVRHQHQICSSYKHRRCFHLLHAVPVLSELPEGISPFEKGASKNLDVQGDFRLRAQKAVEEALKDNLRLIEIEFPPLIGGDQSKSQFDDFDNVQELDKNKDWAIQFAPYFSTVSTDYRNGKTWLIFPDTKECELARYEWKGSRYQESTFTTIEAATNFLCGVGSYEGPWGANIVGGLSKILGGKDGDAGLLGDQSSLDSLDNGMNFPPLLQCVVQPGNGGPVEDWCNCEQVFDASPETTSMVVINGALDKLRGGFYPAVFFPKLASCVDRFYNRFESIFYLKPITDKGMYGWLYRVYPEVRLMYAKEIVFESYG